MTTPSIRGHQTYFKVYENGSEQVIDCITNFNSKLDSSMMRSFYVGKAQGEADQSIEGWSGSFDIEVKDDNVEKFIDALVTNNLNGIGVSDYTLIDSEQYPNGTRSDYMYYDMTFDISKKTGGQGEKVTKTVNFQASGRTRL